MKNKYLFSIAVCTKDRAMVLSKTLKALFAFSAAFAPRVEILIIDQSDTDSTLRLITGFRKQFKKFDMRYLKCKQKGISFSRNIALKESSGMNIIFIDDDVLVTRDWLNKIQKNLTKYKSAEVFGGKILPYKFDYLNHTPPDLKLIKKDGCIWPLALCDKGDKYITYPPYEDPFFVTALLVVRRKNFEKYGTFDESFGNLTGKLKLYGGEDTEYIKRLICKKVKMVYCPDIISYHLIPDYKLSRKYLRWRYFENGKERANLDRIYSSGKLNVNLKELFSEIYFNFKRSSILYLAGRREYFINEANLFYILGYLRAGFYFKTIGPKRS